MTAVRVGDIYRIKKRYEVYGPPFIRVVHVDRRNHRLGVVDYMQDGQLAGNYFKEWRGPRNFTDESGWTRLRKYWRRVQ